jgi:hypothetical protein
MPTDLDAAVAARNREAQAQTQTLVTMVSVWVIIAITLIANLILLILYWVPSQIAWNQTSPDGTKQIILYNSLWGKPLSGDCNRYQTIASPTGFSVLITASGGAGYQSPSMGTQYWPCLMS